MTNPTGDGTLLRRYALARALIPDRDEADDLFRLSRSEADLWRRAEVWLSRRGQAVPLAEPPLPELDAEQQEHAQHLARLGQKRRVLVPLAAVLAVLGLIIGLVVLYRWDRSRLSAATVYGEKPIAETTAAGYRVALYKAEENADEGTITVWWSVANPALEPTVAEAVAPRLLVKGTRFGGGWAELIQTVVERPQLGKYLGRSTYRTPMPRATEVGVRFESIGTQAIGWMGELPLRRTGTYSREQTVAVEQLLGDRSQAVRIRSVTTAPSYTLVRYTGGRSLLNSNVMVWPAGGAAALPNWGVRDAGRGEVEEIYGPVLPGTSELKLFLAAMGSELPSDLLLNLADANVKSFATVTRDGQQVQVSLKVAPDFADRLAPSTAYRLVAAGVEYSGTATWSDAGEVRVLKVTATVPASVSPTQLRMLNLATPPSPSAPAITVKLP